MTSGKVSVTDKLKITFKTLVGMRVNCRLTFEHCSGRWNRNHKKMKHDMWSLGQQSNSSRSKQETKWPET